MERKTNIEKTLFFSFIISVILGTLLHFAFEYSGRNTVIGAFTPVNESIWEHLKLILIPSITVGFFEYFSFGKEYKGYFGARGFATLIGILFLLTGYYTYSGIVGADYFIADIILFILATGLTSILTFVFITKLNLGERSSIIGIMIITVFVLLFMYFTFDPPMLEMFRDPLSEDFGIQDLT